MIVNVVPVSTNIIHSYIRRNGDSAREVQKYFLSDQCLVIEITEDIRVENIILCKIKSSLVCSFKDVSNRFKVIMFQENVFTF